MRKRFFTLPTFFQSCCFSSIFFGILISIFFMFSSDAYSASAQVTLAWDANTEPELAGYKIYCGTSSGNYTHSIDVGNQTSYSISGLEEGKTYYFVATAYNSNGSESGFSNEASQYIAKPDTDGDGMPDDWEMAHFGTLDRDGTGDFDNDGISDLDEYLNGTDPVSSTVVSETNIPPLETGELSVDHNWKRVELNKSFSDPVVVAKPLSFNGGDPAVVRLRNVDTTGFEIRIQEWDYLDGWHVPETVSYIVMERGSYILNDGTRVEAGRFETDATSSFETVTFGQTFQTVPVLLTMVSTFNETDAVTTRVQGISAQGFEFRMQEQELNTQSHVTETVSYVAWEPSLGIVDGLAFEISKTGDVVQHGFQTLQFGQSFTKVPVFLADMQTTDGGDTANVRWQNKDVYAVDVMIDEEQSLNSETDHATEVVGYMAFEKVGDTLASSTIDTEAPMVSIAAPGYGATIDGTANVEVEASDDTGVAKVELYVDGALHATDTSGPFSFSFDTSGLSDGECELVAKAYDAAGNVGQSETILVHVNNGSPVVSTTIHVESITVTTLKASKGNSKGRAEVIILDDCGSPVAGAVVTGTFTGDINETTTATTNSSGVAILGTTGMAKRPSITFCVDDVILGSLNYNPSENVETCDSN